MGGLRTRKIGRRRCGDASNKRKRDGERERRAAATGRGVLFVRAELVAAASETTYLVTLDGAGREGMGTAAPPRGSFRRMTATAGIVAGRAPDDGGGGGGT